MVSVFFWIAFGLYRIDADVIDNQNRSNINLLEDSLFVLCLDDSVRKSIESINGLTAAGSGGSDVNLLAKMSSLLVHGGGSLLHTSNRWFDKFLQVFFNP